MSISRMSKEYQDEMKRRIAARRLNRRQQRYADAQERRLERIDGHEHFWIKAVMMHVRSSSYFYKVLGFLNYPTEKEFVRLLARSTSRGRTFNEALAYVVFDLAGMGGLKEL